eukprot:GHVL01034899.1.p1 GENE.GHVL01034899.1~~GHVL01034899.1.p1  ORF type:complete len:215 (-),score=9.22 GHVL01034899.1:1440-2084(-)
MNAIPKQWKDWIVDNPAHIVNVDIIDDELNVFKSKPKLIKLYLKKKRNYSIEKSHAIDFWKRKLDFVFVEQTWLLPRQVTKEVRLRVLQWKICHNLYPTNILLHKMKVSQTKNCNECPHILDVMEHFFYECPRIRRFWTYIEKMLNSLTGRAFLLSITDVLFGIEKCQESALINHVLLIAKMCISKVKKTKSHIPLEIVFQQELALRKVYPHCP